jgi:hypothetical protein
MAVGLKERHSLCSGPFFSSRTYFTCIGLAIVYVAKHADHTDLFPVIYQFSASFYRLSASFRQQLNNVLRERKAFSLGIDSKFTFQLFRQVKD